MSCQPANAWINRCAQNCCCQSGRMPLATSCQPAYKCRNKQAYTEYSVGYQILHKLYFPVQARVFHFVWQNTPSSIECLDTVSHGVIVRITYAHFITVCQSVTVSIILFFAASVVISNSTATYLVWLQRDQWYRKHRTGIHSIQFWSISDPALQHSHPIFLQDTLPCNEILWN